MQCGPRAATRNTAPNLNVANTRAWFLANWDVDSILTGTAIINWMGAWDDVCHNHYFWRRANGKWNILPWDFDSLMTSTRTSQTINAGEQGAADDPVRHRLV
jgi:spore coat protein CotH